MLTSCFEMITQICWSSLLILIIYNIFACASPNVVVIFTDDQDLLLKSLEFLPKIDKLLVNKGVSFLNAVSRDFE